MIVRGIDDKGDWIFGLGRQAYKSKVKQVEQRIATHIRSWLWDCFFDLSAGIDWKNMLGSYNKKKEIIIAVRKQILSIEEVEQILSLDATINDRDLTITCNVLTTYGYVSSSINITGE